MVYSKIGFNDRVDTKSDVYLVNGIETSITKDNSGVVQNGTNLNADNLNHMEDGIFQNSQDIETIKEFNLTADSKLQEHDGEIQSLGEQMTDYTNFKATKGQASGLASLGSDGKVPSTQLPTFSDGAWEKISEITLASNAADIIITGISSAYKVLRAIAIVNGTSSLPVYITFNDISTTTYGMIGVLISSSSVTNYYKSGQAYLLLNNFLTPSAGSPPNIIDMTVFSSDSQAPYGYIDAQGYCGKYLSTIGGPSAGKVSTIKLSTGSVSYPFLAGSKLILWGVK